MVIGYARISTPSQSLNLQLDALQGAGCEKVFSDQMSGAKAARPGLQEALNFARPGDVLLVWRLDRLGRSIKDLIEIVTSLEEKNISFKSIHEGIDTSTSTGKFFFYVFGALAEFERNLIQERTQAGRAAARARGIKGGRPSVSTEKQKLALKLYNSRQHTVEEMTKILGISRPTLYKYVRLQQNKKALA